MYVCMFFVNRDEDRPYGTLLLMLTASSKDLKRIKYRIGTKSSSFVIGASPDISIIVG
jgi:hypothetical protein